jgi:hypothetical protein
MGIFIVIVFLALSSWALVAVFRRLRHQRATPGRWLAVGVLVGCGVAVGIWCAFYVEYHIGSHYRVGSFGIPWLQSTRLVVGSILIMTPNVSKIRRRAGWGIFEFICFLAACALVWPVAHLVGQRYFPNHSRTVFWIIMLTAYPVLGFAFCCLMHRLFRWDYNRRQNRTKHDDSK